MASEVSIIVKAEAQGEEKVAALAKSIEQGFRQGATVLDSFNAQVEKAFAQLEADSARAAKGVEAAFATLGTRSTGSVEREIETLSQAYRTLEQAGTVSLSDLARAHEAYEGRVDKLRASLKGAAQDMGAEETMARRLAAALSRLNVRTIDGVERELRAAARDFEELRGSGRLSMEDLALATAAYERRVESLNRELGGLKGEAIREITGSTAAMNRQMTLGHGLAGRMRQELLGIGAGLAGFIALERVASGLVGSLKGAEAANFKLASSVGAASREFGEGVGTAESWKRTLRELSSELRVYSQSELAGAAARTLDMTKRMGLSEAQMGELLRRTADLTAGTTDLDSGIERVTSAMRGEAESAELLGLTLSAEYVQAWYAAHEAHGQAWQDLSEMEKAQVRYRIFLEQTDAVQGRAAASVATLGGAWRFLGAALENAIVNNADVAQAMKEVADVVRDNAQAIGQGASELLSFVAGALRATLALKEFIAVGLGVYAATKSVRAAADALEAVRKVSLALRAVRLAEFFTQTAAAAAIGTGPFGLLVALAAAAGVGLGLLINKMMGVGQEAKEVERAEARLARQTKELDRAAQQLGESLGLEIRSFEELARLQKEGFVVQDKLTGAWRLGERSIVGLRAGLTLTAGQMADLSSAVKRTAAAYSEARAVLNAFADIAVRTIRGRAQDEALAARQILEINRERYRQTLEIAQQEAARKEALIRSTHAADRQVADLRKGVAKDLAGAQVEAVKAWKTNLEAALDASLARQKAYAEEVKRLEREIKEDRQSTEDKIRELRRKTMSEEAQWRDRERQAEETLAKVRKAAASNSPEALKEAIVLAQKASEQFAGLAHEVRKGDQVVVTMGQSVRTAIRGVEESSGLIENIKKKLLDLGKTGEKNEGGLGEALRKELQEVAATIEGLEAKRITLEASITPNTADIDAAIERLKQPTSSVHTVHVREERSSGGSSDDSLGFSGGGHVPGVGDGDTVPAYLTPGEFVLRKAAVRQLGLPFLRALNALSRPVNIASALAASFAPRVEASMAPLRFASGGLVPSMSAPSDLGTLKLDIGGRTYPVMARPDVAKELADHLRRENLMRPNK